MKIIIISVLVSTILIIARVIVALDAITFSCIKMVIDKGYASSVAAESCSRMVQMEVNCLKYVLDIGGSPLAGKDVCTGISKLELDCIKELNARGIDVNTARQNCK